MPKSLSKELEGLRGLAVRKGDSVEEYRKNRMGKVDEVMVLKKRILEGLFLG